MEKTYTYKITTLDGKEQEIVLKRMTVRFALRLQAVPNRDRQEALLDMVTPEGTLDIISPESWSETMKKIMEVEKDFFAQMAEVTLETTKKPKSRRGKKKKKG